MNQQRSRGDNHGGKSRDALRCDDTHDGGVFGHIVQTDVVRVFVAVLKCTRHTLDDHKRGRERVHEHRLYVYISIHLGCGLYRCKEYVLPSRRIDSDNVLTSFPAFFDYCFYHK